VATYLPEDVLQRLNVSRESLVKLETYVQLLLTWQAKINLIGPSTIEGVWKRHVLDGLQLLPLMAPKTEVIADLGSGAGIPGLILALGGNLKVHLYERWPFSARLSDKRAQMPKFTRFGSKRWKAICQQNSRNM
jgi:16S rRNA G527 N7-methylase RsmG